jgi:RND family efflux transporter MFP subunit
MGRRIWGLLLVPLIGLGAGCAKKAPPPPPPSVIVATPLQRQVSDWDDYVGRFEATNTVDIRPRVSGYVQKVAFKDGQIVHRGQILFEIDPRPYEAAVQQALGQQARAVATLADAKVELNRSRSLLAAKATSQQDVDTRQAAEQQAEADLQAAKAAVDTAQLNLGFTHVVAPIDGRVSDSRAQPGNLVAQDTTVMTDVVALDPIRFAFQAPEDLLLKYQRAKIASDTSGTPVQIRLQDETSYSWNGKIAFVDNAVDTGSGTIRAYAVAPNHAMFLKPGMFGHMRLQSSSPHAALLVPDEAVVTDLNRQLVYVVTPDGTIAQRQVRLGALIDGLRIIRSGLEPTDRVVISGVQRAHPGEKVTAIAGRIAPQPGASAQPDLGPPPGSATFAP